MLWKAPAKINLFLRVLRKRTDGYHYISSLMQKITFFDELTFAPCPSGIALNCPGSSLPTSEDNLIFRAAQSIFDYTGYPYGIEITLTKKIPLAAGLGGGSSDAATTLIALNKICSLGLKKRELMTLGAKLGADVPFFIFGDTALASGIGDRLKAAPKLPELNLLLINPHFQLSTKTVYENINLRLTSQKINYSIPRFFALGDVIRELHNDLEEVALKLHPELNNLKQILLCHGALGALMSGSGPTVFGIFPDEKTAIKAVNAMKKDISPSCTVFLARSL